MIYTLTVTSESQEEIEKFVRKPATLWIGPSMGLEHEALQVVIKFRAWEKNSEGLRFGYIPAIKALRERMQAVHGPDGLAECKRAIDAALESISHPRAVDRFDTY